MHEEVSYCSKSKQTINHIRYLQYKYDYDSQTNSVFAHNCKEQNNLY